MSRHGRAILPFGKYKGVRIRLVPDSYLSWLSTSIIMTDPRWWWLKESLLAELRHRGMRADLAGQTDDTAKPQEPRTTRAFSKED